MRIPLSFVLACGIGACVTSPLEHSNYFDAAFGAKLTITSDVDSLDSSLALFTFAVTSQPDFPAERPGAETYRVAGPVTQVDNMRWRTTSAGLFWTPVTIRAVVRNGLPPSADITVWVRQRPVDVLLSCTSGCGPNAVGVGTMLYFTLVDANAGSISLPGDPYRFGTVEAATPGIVSILGRPSPATISVGRIAPGSTYIRFSGEGISDSILVTVTP
jgi:hypothetical protein